MLRDLPRVARWYIVSVIGLGALTFIVLVPRASLAPVGPLIVLILLTSLTSTFKVQFPIASGSNMSVSHVVDIAALILRGPHATMIVGAASALAQSTLNVRSGNPFYRTLFNMAVLALTAQAAGQVYVRLGGTPHVELNTIALPLIGMALTYFIVNTLPIAFAIALTTGQDAWRVWKTEFVSSVPSYLLGAAAAAVTIAVTERSGYWLTVLLTAAPLYLTYKMYRAGAASEAQQGAILQAAHDAIVTVDATLSIREFNPAAERMFGYSRMSVLGRHVEILIPPAERPSKLEALAKYGATGGGPLRGRQIEVTALRADGAEFPVELTVARVGADSRAVITGFLRDITDRRKLEEQLRESQKLEAIGRLATSVAHDFNNLLMSIMGSADLLLMELRPNDPSRDEVTEIKRAVHRGAGLTGQLLAFSRRQATRPRVFSLGDVIGGMETMLQRLMGPEIDFNIVHPTTPTMVVADPVQIEQLVLNLVVNARDAMVNGGRLRVTIEEVEASRVPSLAQIENRSSRYACLSVSDTGTGIDERTRARLFEPFFTTKEHDKGTGLGLSIVYGIVRQNHGFITVESDPGRGATFLIYLPIATTAIEPLGPVAPDKGAGIAEASRSTEMTTGRSPEA